MAEVIYIWSPIPEAFCAKIIIKGNVGIDRRSDVYWECE